MFVRDYSLSRHGTCRLRCIANPAPANPAPAQQAGKAMQSFARACEDWDEWDKPRGALLIHGNTWYVGTCGISAILIEGDDGLVLIDTGTAKRVRKSSPPISPALASR